MAVVTVGLDNEIRNRDSDPKFFLSDGTRGIGFELQEGMDTTVVDIVVVSIIAIDYKD